MAITAPGTRFAAISRATKSSNRAKPCWEKPSSSGFASGNDAACTALYPIANTITAVRPNCLTVSPSYIDLRTTRSRRPVESERHGHKNCKSTALSGAVHRQSLLAPARSCSLEEARKRGVRHIQLVHYTPNERRDFLPSAIS